jgi:hypothetical protein
MDGKRVARVKVERVKAASGGKGSAGDGVETSAAKTGGPMVSKR